MKKIDRYILKEMMLPIIFGVSLFTFMFMIDIITMISETLIVKSVPFIEIMTMFSYLTPAILVETVPMGIFFGIMITYNGMSSSSEVVAMQASGISLNRMIKVPLIIGMITTAGVYLFQESVLTVAQDKAERLMRKIAYTKPASQLKPKKFISGIGDFSIYVDSLEGENVAKNTIVFNKTAQSPYPNIFIAKKTVFTKSEIRLEKVKAYFVIVKPVNGQARNEVQLVEGTFGKKVIPTSGFFGDFKSDKKKESSMSIRALWEEIKIKKSTGDFYRLAEVEFYRKLYVPLSAIILAILAPLLSIRHARTIKGLSLGISLAVIFAYITAMNSILAVAENGTIAPSWGLAIPNLILLVITIVTYTLKSRR